MQANDISEVISKAKEVVEQALPLESSVLKDQLVLMVASRLMMPSEFPVMPPMIFPFEGMIAVELTKLAMKKDKEQVWDTFGYFIKKLTKATRVHGQMPEIVDERGGI